MPHVTVTWLAGRSKEQKGRVARAINDAVVHLGGAYPDRVDVVFHDVPLENWALGGELLSEGDDAGFRTRLASTPD
jgi:4-oxalocrotonate tautomerase